MSLSLRSIRKIYKMKIKVCGMRESENLKALAQLPIDYVGFIFYNQSKRLVENKIEGLD